MTMSVLTISKLFFSRIIFVFIICTGSFSGLSHPATAGQTKAILPDPSSPSGSAYPANAGISSLEQRVIEEGLVNVQLLDPSIKVDLKYARPDNFMGMNVYGDLVYAYLRPPAALKLVQANEILRRRHPDLRILVVDAVRPRCVQQFMWNIVAGTPMQPYVADPQFGSMHNYGAAVDVTLYNEKTKTRLDMGTPIDYFGPLAQPRLESSFLQEDKLSTRQVENRLILRETMLAAGWHMIEIEWWHFNAFSKYEIRKNFGIIE